MAAFQDTVNCPGNTATMLCDSVAVTSIRVVSTEDFYFLATSTDTPPSSRDGGVPILPYTVVVADADLMAQLFPAVTGPYYFWAWPTSGAADVEVSHA